MERITYGKKILKILGAVLGVFVFLVVALSMCAAVMDWEFRALLTDILAAKACLIGIGFAADIAYLIWAYTTERGKWAAGKAFGIVCMIGVIAGTVFFSLVGFFGYIFMRSEERTAYIDGQKYVARLETRGWKSVGISYHRMHGVFCEREGWEVEFDYKLWDTYR